MWRLYHYFAPRDSGGAEYYNWFVQNVHNVDNVYTEFAPTINSRRQMAGSPPNFHTWHDGLQVSVHPGCAQGQGKGQRSRDTGTILLCWQENRFFSHANDRINASSLQSNISSISVTLPGGSTTAGEVWYLRLPCFIWQISNDNNIITSAFDLDELDPILLFGFQSTV